MNAVLDDDLTGRELAHYTIVGLIGSGGTGRVYLGRDERLERHVAIKALRDDSAYVAGRSRGLLAEARMLSRFSHPNVATIYDFITHNGREYIVMEFVPGPTLKEVVAAGPLPNEELLRIGVQLAKGLAAAHAAGVVHRDVKPQNVKLTPSGRVKIVDFGIASPSITSGVVESWMDTSSEPYPLGTIPYMSPEQIRGDQLDERTDVFSAGSVLYEMATSRRAFPQRDLGHLVHAIQYEDPLPQSSANPFVLGPLERVVSKALQKDRNRRHRDAAALAADLVALRRSHAHRVRMDRRNRLACREGVARH